MKWSYVKGRVAMMFLAGVGVVLTPASVSAETDLMLTNEERARCEKTMLLFNFPKEIVLETLKKYQVPEEKWPDIVKALEVKDKEIFKILEKKAATMNPNPLKDPGEHQNIPKLIRAVVLETFTNVLKENGVEDTTQFQAMLDDIQQERVKKFAKCLKKD